VEGQGELVANRRRVVLTWREVETWENVEVNGSRTPSHEEIADILRARIRSGELKAGERLPTHERLMEEFGVGRGAVRQARELLSKEKLISNLGKGRRPTVAKPSAAVEAMFQPTLVGLAPRLEAAFSVPHVKIDAVCLTAETLMRSMDAPMRLMEKKSARPETIETRIVLPRKELKLLYPAPFKGWGHDEEVDAAVHGRSITQQISQTEVLRGHFRQLRDLYKIEATVTFRYVDNTPYQKVYLLNKTEALVAHYTMAKKEDYVDGDLMKLWDAWGTESTLFSFNKEYGARDERFVEESQKWFDGLWEALDPKPSDV
jgi:hypothetical protein